MEKQYGKTRSLYTRFRKQRYVWAMLSPALVLLFIFSYLPLSGWVMAFTDYQLGSGLFSGRFTGLLQFKRFFSDSNDFGYLLRNTLFINVTTIVVSVYLALGFTLLLCELPWQTGRSIVQTVTFFPYFISWVTIYALTYALFSVRLGAINEFLVNTGIRSQGINILGDMKYSWPLMIFLNLWKGLGYNSIIFLATIKGISGELYEAAALDGVSRFQRIRFITVPACTPTICILLVMQSGMIFSNNLEQFFVFTNATNWQTMEVFDQYIYKFGLKMADFPYATAVGVVKSLVSILVLFLCDRLSKKIMGISMFI
jgi:putative aldouronate transport system permease protein